MDLDAYLTARLARERDLAEQAAEAFEATGDPLWLALHRLHLEDADDLSEELVSLGRVQP